jgi:hypothetical protein
MARDYNAAAKSPDLRGFAPRADQRTLPASAPVRWERRLPPRP